MRPLPGGNVALVCAAVRDGRPVVLKLTPRGHPDDVLLASEARTLCFAGLWTRGSAPRGEVVPSCTIITCAANELARPIHDRMPVVLAGHEAWHAWLDPSLDSSAARELLSPLRPHEMVVRPASPVVNSTRNDGPSCLVLPVAA